MAKLFSFDCIVAVALLFAVFVLTSFERHVKADEQLSGVSETVLKQLKNLNIDQFKELEKYTQVKLYKAVGIAPEALTSTLKRLGENEDIPDVIKQINVFEVNFRGLNAKAKNSKFHLFNRMIQNKGEQGAGKISLVLISAAVRLYTDENGTECADYYIGISAFDFDPPKFNWTWMVAKLVALAVIVVFTVLSFKYNAPEKFMLIGGITAAVLLLSAFELDDVIPLQSIIRYFLGGIIGTGKDGNGENTGFSLTNKNGFLNKELLANFPDIIEANFINEMTKRGFAQLKDGQIILKTDD